MTTSFTESLDGGFAAEQRAGSKMDYALDWSAWLAAVAGDTISTSTWASLDARLDLSGQTHSGTEAKVWVEVPVGLPSDWYVLENTITTAQGRRDSRVCLIYVKPSITDGSALFPNRIVAVLKMRRDRLVLLAGSIMPDLTITDEYIWEKLMAAEAEIGHQLRVPLRPTHFFPYQPTEQQLSAIGSMPWAIDPPYDYNPGDWYGDKWGLILTRQKPIQQINGMRFVYPSPAQTIVDVPADWIRSDNKYGQVQLVPTGTAYQTLLGGLFMSHLSGGKTLPFTIALEYVAGLANVQRDFPDLIDAVQKLAALKIVQDGFMPQSGSISADGLSQSLSVDTSKYADDVDNIINGRNGNGGLMARIHGIRAMVL